MDVSYKLMNRLAVRYVEMATIAIGAKSDDTLRFVMMMKQKQLTKVIAILAKKKNTCEMVLENVNFF